MDSKKQLAVLLSRMKPFEHPDPSLEQYPTDSEVAASLLWQAFLEGDIEHKRVADFGCGTGILGIGALALGAKHATFIELDPRIFPVLMENLALLEELSDRTYGNYEIIQGNVASYDEEMDTILQNPPFGTRGKGADTAFLDRALQLAPAVYSLHKTSTEEYIRKLCNAQDAHITWTERYQFPLKQTLPDHTRKIHRIAVSAFRITRQAGRHDGSERPHPRQ